MTIFESLIGGRKGSSNLVRRRKEEKKVDGCEEMQKLSFSRLNDRTDNKTRSSRTECILPWPCIRWSAESRLRRLFLSFRPHGKETIPDKFITRQLSRHRRVGRGAISGKAFIEKRECSFQRSAHRIIVVHRRTTQWSLP